MTVMLPPDIEQRLEALAQRTGRSANDHLQDAVLEHLADLEDASIADQRWADLEGPGVAIPYQ